ncbi:MAG: VOC family protein [Gammaproteobacteria bacterium]|nr:VOC family protein [Gammaproteobacteria bacterium]
MPKLKRINHTGVSVADMERSLAFYCDLLGMELIFDSDVADAADLSAVVGMDDARGRVVWLRVGDTMLELWQWDHPGGRSLPPDYRPADRGVTHFALEVDDVDALYRRVIDAGFPANTEPRDLGLHKTTYIRGPDAEIIEILEDRATDAWLEKLTARARAARAARS